MNPLDTPVSLESADILCNIGNEPRVAPQTSHKTTPKYFQRSYNARKTEGIPFVMEMIQRLKEYNQTEARLRRG
jgi:hypothetical protein